ncbi:MAG: hypothetical protein IV100_30515 [Myxococcales bacterium]|nr:hypothetical protein [Myxococcales bacterium]
MEECTGSAAVNKSFCVPSVALGSCILRADFTPRWCGFPAVDNGLFGDEDEDMNINAGKDNKGSSCNAGSRGCSCLLRRVGDDEQVCALGLECRVDEEDSVKRCFARPVGSATAASSSSSALAPLPLLVAILVVLSHSH